MTDPQTAKPTVETPKQRMHTLGTAIVCITSWKLTHNLSRGRLWPRVSYLKHAQSWIHLSTLSALLSMEVFAVNLFNSSHEIVATRSHDALLRVHVLVICWTADGHQDLTLQYCTAAESTAIGTINTYRD
jgi:hypothetical protein